MGLAVSSDLILVVRISEIAVTKDEEDDNNNNIHSDAVIAKASIEIKRLEFQIYFSKFRL
jgi:hypothetical protein